MPFYKKDVENILVGDSVSSPEYTLTDDNKGEHAYPIDGWFWYASLDAAISAFASVPNVDEVPMWAARRVLIAAGLMQPILNALAAMPGIEGEIARSDFEYAPNIVRSSAFITYAQGLLDMTAEQIDGLFVQAKEIVGSVA